MTGGRLDLANNLLLAERTPNAWLGQRTDRLALFCSTPESQEIGHAKAHTDSSDDRYLSHKDGDALLTSQGGRSRGECDSVCPVGGCGSRCCY